MKFKEKRGNTFVFDGGYAGEELELEYLGYSSTMGEMRKYKHVIVTPSLHISKDVDSFIEFSDIQTAVNLMQILIKEGLV